MGHDGPETVKALMELFKELMNATNSFWWNDCRRALKGVRKGWAQDSLRSVKVLVDLACLTA